jgi:hypothetical protein
VNAQVKVPGIVAGMIAEADRIDDLDLLLHGAMPALFGGIRARRVSFPGTGERGFHDRGLADQRTSGTRGCPG